MSSVRDDDIRSGPIDYFVGGIGDTLAKWYESAPVFARADKLSAFDRLSQRSAALIRDVLIEESEPALRSLQTGVLRTSQPITRLCLISPLIESLRRCQSQSGCEPGAGLRRQRRRNPLTRTMV